MKNMYFPTDPFVISRGGIDDRALGMPKSARKALDKVIERSGVPMLETANYAESVETAHGDIQRIFQRCGHCSLCERRRWYDFRWNEGRLKECSNRGLNRSIPRGDVDIDSIMTRFVLDGISGDSLIQNSSACGKNTVCRCSR